MCFVAVVLDLHFSNEVIFFLFSNVIDKVIEVTHAHRKPGYDDIYDTLRFNFIFCWLFLFFFYWLQKLQKHKSWLYSYTNDRNADKNVQGQAD